MTLAPRICPRCGAASQVALCGTCGVSCIPSLLDGRYMLERLVRHDAAGARFQAVDQANNNAAVAVRVGTVLDHVWLERFHKELKLVASVEHPAVSKVLDGGVEVEGRAYVVSQWQDGTVLDSLLEKEGALPVTRAFSIASQVLRALHELHSVASMHGNLTTGSVLLLSPGTRDAVKLLDVGFSWPTGQRLTDDAGPADVRRDIQAAGHLLAAMLDGGKNLPLPPVGQQAVDALLAPSEAGGPVSALHAQAVLQKLAPNAGEVSNAFLMVLETNEFSLVEQERRARSHDAEQEMTGSRKFSSGQSSPGRAILIGSVAVLVLALAAAATGWSGKSRQPSSKPAKHTRP